MVKETKEEIIKEYNYNKVVGITYAIKYIVFVLLILLSLALIIEFFKTRSVEISWLVFLIIIALLTIPLNNMINTMENKK